MVVPAARTQAHSTPHCWDLFHALHSHCYANGDSQTSPHFQSTVSSEMVNAHPMCAGLSLVQTFYVILLYKLKAMTHQLMVQRQGIAVSLWGSRRLNFRVFFITIIHQQKSQCYHQH